MSPPPSSSAPQWSFRLERFERLAATDDYDLLRIAGAWSSPAGDSDPGFVELVFETSSGTYALEPTMARVDSLRGPVRDLWRASYPAPVELLQDDTVSYWLRHEDHAFRLGSPADRGPRRRRAEQRPAPSVEEERRAKSGVAEAWRHKFHELSEAHAQTQARLRQAEAELADAHRRAEAERERRRALQEDESELERHLADAEATLERERALAEAERDRRQEIESQIRGREAREAQELPTAAEDPDFGETPSGDTLAPPLPPYPEPSRLRLPALRQRAARPRPPSPGGVAGEAVLYDQARVRPPLLATRRFAFTVLAVTGAMLMADAAATVLWQEPVTALYANRQQGKLDRELAGIEREFVTRIAPQLREKQRRAQLRRFAAAFEARQEGGEPIGRIGIEGIGLRSVVLDGVDSGSLRNGPGRYPDTHMPGSGRTVAIAGHRTTYSAPFRRINDLEEGDPISISTPYGTFTYEVESTRVVEPSDTSVLHDIGYDRLVLTACHPLYSNAQRIVAFARLEEAELRRGA